MAHFAACAQVLTKARGIEFDSLADGFERKGTGCA